MKWSKNDLNKIRSRDKHTFSRLYNEYKSKIYNYLLTKANGNEDIANDIFSETFKSALISAPKLKDVNSILSWLFRIANRRFFDYLRIHYKDKNFKDNFNGEDLIYDNLTEDYETKEIIFMIKNAIENLKPEYGEVLKLKYNDHMSQKEIAQALQKTEYSVSNLIFKARNALKKELNKYYKDI